jgi:hypothetical protein
MMFIVPGREQVLVKVASQLHPLLSAVELMHSSGHVWSSVSDPLLDFFPFAFHFWGNALNIIWMSLENTESDR